MKIYDKNGDHVEEIDDKVFIKTQVQNIKQCMRIYCNDNINLLIFDNNDVLQNLISSINKDDIIIHIFTDDDSIISKSSFNDMIMNIYPDNVKYTYINKSDDRDVCTFITIDDRLIVFSHLEAGIPMIGYIDDEKRGIRFNNIFDDAVITFSGDCDE